MFKNYKYNIMYILETINDKRQDLKIVVNSPTPSVSCFKHYTKQMLISILKRRVTRGN